MKKLNKWIFLLWKSHKKELELKKEIRKLNCEILSKDTEISNEKLITQSWKNKADEYYLKLQDIRDNTLHFRMQKYINNYSMNPYQTIIDQKYADEYFKKLVDEYKKNFVNELIEKGCIKEVDTNEYLEWQIRVMKD